MNATFALEVAEELKQTTLLAHVAEHEVNQENWEAYGSALATKRWREAAASSTPDQLPGGQRLLRQIIPPLAAKIAEELSAPRERKGVKGWLWTIQALVEVNEDDKAAETLAVITATTCLRMAGVSDAHQAGSMTKIAQEICDVIRVQIEHDRWVAKAKQTDEGKWLLEAFQRRYPAADRRAWSRSRTKVQEARSTPWSAADKLHLGAFLIDSLVATSPYFIPAWAYAEDGALRKSRVLTLSPEAAEMMRDVNTRAEVARPLLMPMITPPRPWTYAPDGTSDGGYRIINKPMVRTGTHKHTLALKQPVSPADLEALNVVQATPWRINGFILDVAQEAWERGQPIAGLEKAVLKPVPLGAPAAVWDALGWEERKAWKEAGRMPDEVFATLSDKEKETHREARKAVHEANAGAIGREWANLDKLSIATALRDRHSIWFPHSRDWRGRIYPIPSAGPTPQGDDLAKALLMFSAGLPLGPEKEYWLCIRAANAWADGPNKAKIDKMALPDRVKWALANCEDIIASAEDPLVHTWWAQADDPWQFLATCHELAQAWAMDDPSEFISHLPIPMDGTCNGLQHLSAMGLDPVGARATNLCTGVDRQDIYDEIAAKVAAMVAEDAAADLPPALQWHGKITRKVVKRAVMTTPYGVTNGGIARQLVKDKHVPKGDIQRGKAAAYLRDKLSAALSDTVSGAKAIMAWLQEAAEGLASAGLPFDWTTPTGSRCRQAYSEVTLQEVATLCGRLVLAKSVDEAIIPALKQARGAAPNYVHSFDAAHLTMTINEAHKDGVRSFAMVHDSYGTHARNTTTLAAILREQFVLIYSDDWLARTAAEIRAYAPQVDLPERPARGSFDVRQVINAPFFFS